MYTERVQILLSRQQRRRLEAEARRRKASVGSLIREAIDARFGARFTREERIRAVEEIGRMRGRSLTVEEMERIVDEEREANFPAQRERR